MDSERKSSPRLPGYPYDLTGAYYVTICTKGNESLFGSVQDGQIVLTPLGEIAQTTWLDLPNHYPHVRLDEYVIMPDHVHGIVVLIDDADVRRDRFRNLSLQEKPFKRHGLSEIVRGFKTWAARRINEYRSTTGTPVWQRSFYDRIIRDETDLNRIRQYIRDNPLRIGKEADNEIELESPHN